MCAETLILSLEQIERERERETETETETQTDRQTDRQRDFDSLLLQSP